MEKFNSKNLKKLLPKTQKGVSLEEYTSFRIGGKAKYFFIAETKEELIKAISAAKKLNLPFFILGGGSNLLISDKGFNGLVIKNLNIKYYTLNAKIVTGTGISLSKLVAIATKKRLTGLEWASGIPGTVGGAIFGNAGSFKKSIGDIIREVEIFDFKDLKIKIYNFKKCEFSYRESIFKRNNNLIILSVTIQLKKGNEKEIKRKIKDFFNYKQNIQPLNFPSAGSIFKNPENISAGALIEKCGLKGEKIRGAMVSEKHANFIINFNNAKSEDVKSLIKLIKTKVKNKFKIKLKEEIKYL